MKRVAVLDGSLNGKRGNTSVVVESLIKLLEPEIHVDYIELKDVTSFTELEERLIKADGFIIATGTYWQSWGSPLQKFFEETTCWEGSTLWLGKPSCVIVTMHSVGGMEIVARLQSNLNLFGSIIPPHCCIAHSFVNQEARKSSNSEDIWDLKYIPTIAHNLKEAINKTHNYKSWVVDHIEKDDVWIRINE